MFSIFFMSIFFMFIALIFIMIATIMSKVWTLNRNKMSVFECGFEPYSPSRLPFSLRFFLIAILFLIFDVEIAIILPLPLSINNMSYHFWLIVSNIFMITLILGIFHEWNFGSLMWIK